MAAAAIAVLLVQGGAAAFRWSFVLMLVATIVDATDGTLARKIGIKKVLPQFDGRKLDDLTDFLTYTFLPLLLVWRAELLPGHWDWVLLLPLLASAYGFCQVEAKTDDGYFLGFPSLWNVVAFYLYVLQLPGWLAVAVVVVFSLLTFVPTRYLYPSQSGKINAAQQRPRRGLGLLDRRDLAAVAGRALSRARWPHLEPGALLALLSRLLHDHLVGDHAQTLAQAEAKHVAADGRQTATQPSSLRSRGRLQAARPSPRTGRTRSRPPPAGPRSRPCHPPRGGPGAARRAGGRRSSPAAACGGRRAAIGLELRDRRAALAAGGGGVGLRRVARFIGGLEQRLEGVGDLVVEADVGGVGLHAFGRRLERGHGRERVRRRRSSRPATGTSPTGRTGPSRCRRRRAP